MASNISKYLTRIQYPMRCFYRSALLIFLFLSPVFVQASDTEPIPQAQAKQDPPNLSQEKQYLSLFRKLFFSSTYNSLKCHQNIYELLLRAKENDLDLTKIHVIFIFDRDHDKLVPTESIDGMSYGVQRPSITMYKTRIVYNRSDPPGEFRFHVFAVYQDKVMDFDYTNRPRMIPAATYFENMYSSPEMDLKKRRQLFQRLMLRVIPGTEYLQNKLQHTSWYLFDLETKFPSQTLHHFLLNLDKQQAKTSSLRPSD